MRFQAVAVQTQRFRCNQVFRSTATGCALENAHAARPASVSVALGWHSDATLVFAATASVSLRGASPRSTTHPRAAKRSSDLSTFFFVKTLSQRQ